MKKINPFLWFDSEAEQAAKFYVGIFKNSKIGKITHYGEDEPRPKAV
jgi:predicted 3-demethylubiquinone-9 3-methyltransferase (glyoxalase superfamily)